MDIFTGLWLLTRLLLTLMQLSLVYAGSSTAGLKQELHVHQIQRKRGDRTDCPCSCEKATVGPFLVRPKLFRINWNNPREWQKPNSHEERCKYITLSKKLPSFPHLHCWGSRASRCDTGTPAPWQRRKDEHSHHRLGNCLPQEHTM